MSGGCICKPSTLHLKASHCSRVMLIPLCVQATPLSLQEHVDAWEHCIGRPRLHGCAETVHLCLESPCIRIQGSCDAQWPFVRPHPVIGGSVWLPGLSPYSTFTHYCYEVRTLLYRASTGASESYYIALHWQRQKPRPAAVPDATHQLCIIVLRATGQALLREENVTTC